RSAARAEALFEASCVAAMSRHGRLRWLLRLAARHRWIRLCGFGRRSASARPMETPTWGTNALGSPLTVRRTRTQ
ncbi:MAG: hypothetical protein ACXWH7_02495, partial [Thermoanaerobaculia bacterium]